MSISGNVNIVATWSKSVTVTFYNNGCSSSNPTATGYAYNYGTEVTVTTPTAPSMNSGWTFNGYSTKTGGKVTPAGSSMTVGVATNSTNGTAYQICSRTRSATVYYYTGSNRTGTSVSCTQYNGSTTACTYTVPSAAQTSRSVNGNTYAYRGVTYADSNSSTPAGNATTSTPTSAHPYYYVSYSATVTITYNGNGNTSGTVPSAATGTTYMNAAGTTINASITLASPNPILFKSGYFQNGWQTTSTGGTGYNLGATASFSASTTLYTRWAADNYKNNESPEEHFTTLADAVNGTTAGKTITLLTDNLTDNSAVTVNKNLTFDANHKTLLRSNIIYVDSGTLTLTGGIIKNASTYTNHFFWGRGGNITTSDIDITNTNTSARNAAILVNYGTGTFTVGSGTTINNSYGVGISSYSSGPIAVGEATITGAGDARIFAGKINSSSSSSTIDIWSGSTITRTDNGTVISVDASYGAALNIDGGTITGAGADVVSVHSNNATSAINRTAFFMNGGTITSRSGSTGGSALALGLWCSSKCAEIAGGTIESNGSGCALWNGYVGSANGRATYLQVYGATTIRTSSSASNIQVAGATLDIESTGGPIIQSTSGLAINVYNNSGGSGVTSPTAGTLRLKNPTGVAQGSGIRVTSVSNTAIYIGGNSNLEFGDHTYTKVGYSPIAMTGGEGKYAINCVSYNTCGFYGGTLYAKTSTSYLRRNTTLGSYYTKKSGSYGYWSGIYATKASYTGYYTK